MVRSASIAIATALAPECAVSASLNSSPDILGFSFIGDISSSKSASIAQCTNCNSSPPLYVLEQQVDRLNQHIVISSS